MSSTALKSIHNINKSSTNRNESSNLNSNKQQQSATTSTTKSKPTSTVFSKLLQPSSPPASVTAQQLELFQDIVVRRSQQLHSFSLETHQKLYNSLTVSEAASSPSADTRSGDINNNSKSSPITSNEISILFTKLPSKKPSNHTHQYTSLILYILTENFHKSCDTELSASDRRYCFNKLKYILNQIETAYSIWHQEEEKEKQRLRTKFEKERLIAEKNKQQIQSQQPQATATATTTTTTTTATTATAATTTTTPQASSQPAQASQSSNNNSNNNNMGSLVSKTKEHEVIVLDDDEEEELEQNQSKNQNHQQKHNTSNHQTSSTSSSVTTTTTEKNSNQQKERNQPQSQTPNTNKRKISSSSHTKTIPNPSYKPSTKIPPSQQYIPLHIINPRQYLQLSSYQKQSPLTLLFFDDNILHPNSSVQYTQSYSIRERSICRVSINGTFMSCEQTINDLKKIPIYKYPPPPVSYCQNLQSSIYLDGNALDDFQSRLRKWDPYWTVVYDCSVVQVNIPTSNNGNLVQEYGYKTTFITSNNQDRKSNLDRDDTPTPRTACGFPIQLNNLYKDNVNPLDIRWGRKPIDTGMSNQQDAYKQNEKRLLIRTLPLLPNPKYKTLRSDTHQWPKGTFVQLESKVLNPFQQRKQQHHDPKQWKGLSNILDITEYIDAKKLTQKQELSLCAKDCELYGIQVAVCEYTTPDELYDICMSRGMKGSIAKMNYHDGLKHAMKHFEKEMLVLDSDDEDDHGKKDNSNDSGGSGHIDSVTCSLICPVTKQVIKTPVRGKYCKHLNCFDLKTYLHTYAKVSGGRWRCFVCEDFVSVDELVYDGFVAQVLETFGDEIDTTTRDKVQLFSDGTWKLLTTSSSSSMKRNQKKRKLQETRGSEEGSKKLKLDEVIIDID